MRASLAGGAAALAGSFVPGLAEALVVGAIGLAIVPPKSWAAFAWTTFWAVFAGAGARLHGHVFGHVGEAMAAASIGAILGSGLAPSTGEAPTAIGASGGGASGGGASDGGITRLAAVGLGILGALTAGLISRALLMSEALAVLPSGIATLITGATAGFVVGVSSIGRHIVRTTQPIDGDLQALGDDSELGQLLGRAAAAYREAVTAIGDEAPAARAAADEMVRKLTRFGRHWRELELEAARSKPAELHERLALVGRKLEATADPLTRTELGRAAEALRAQVGYLDEIASGRERAVARLQHQVATLERLRLAALRHRSADASRLGAELQPVVDELSQVGGDFDLLSEALTEASGTLQLAPRSIS